MTLTEPEYRALDAVNWSTLKAMADSPAHYLAALHVGRKDTAALRFGRVVDCLLFTPSEFSTRYAIPRFDDFRTKEAKAWKESAEAEGLEVVKPTEVDEARTLADAVRAHPVARRYINAGRYQVPMVWTDEATGLRCKGLADLVGLPNGTAGTFLIDGKSAVNIGKRQYLRDFAKYKYHCQLAHYRNGCRYALNFDPAEIGHIVYEKGQPYDVGVLTFDSYIIDAGEQEVAALLRTVAECRAKNEWPGRYPEPVHVRDDEVPAHLYGDESDDVTVSITED